VPPVTIDDPEVATSSPGGSGCGLKIQPAETAENADTSANQKSDRMGEDIVRQGVECT
jgi:hypothetical protein